jgi:hypothetical protein
MIFKEINNDIKLFENKSNIIKYKTFKIESFQLLLKDKYTKLNEIMDLSSFTSHNKEWINVEHEIPPIILYLFFFFNFIKFKGIFIFK